jgi:hypothetical protein
MAETDQAIAESAQKHGLSEAAAWALWDALVAGRGGQAQFSHPELGGMGQWSGGMTQIGDMFNHGLKAKVAGFCADLAPLAARSNASGSAASFQSQQQGAGSSGVASSFGRRRTDPWWPAALGHPASNGAQDGMRYACFPDRRRLAVERDGTVTLYDTGQHRISGFSQQQSTCSALAFTSQTGPVMLDALPIVEA